MKKNEPVTHVMTKDPVAIPRNAAVSEARRLLQDKDIHHLPVVDGDRLVGILTSTDLLRISFGEFGNQDGRSLDAILDHTYSIPDVMNQNPISIESSGTIRDAAQLLATGDFHSVPVVSDGKLVGIVTSSDLIRYLLAQY